MENIASPYAIEERISLGKGASLFGRAAVSDKRNRGGEAGDSRDFRGNDGNQEARDRGETGRYEDDMNTEPGAFGRHNRIGPNGSTSSTQESGDVDTDADQHTDQRADRDNP